MVARHGWAAARPAAAGFPDLLVASRQSPLVGAVALPRRAPPRRIPRHHLGGALPLRRGDSERVGPCRNHHAAGVAAILGAGVRRSGAGGGAVSPLQSAPAALVRTTLVVVDRHAVDP